MPAGLCLPSHARTRACARACVRARGRRSLRDERRVGGSSSAKCSGRWPWAARDASAARRRLSGMRDSSPALRVVESSRRPRLSTTRVLADDSLTRLWKRRRRREEAVQVSRRDSWPLSTVPRQRETLSTSLHEASSGLVRALLPRSQLARSRGCRPGSRDVSLVTWVSYSVCGDLEEALVPACYRLAQFGPAAQA